jgi:hypothetical protein
VEAARYPLLITENSDNIITENGDDIGLGPQYTVATGDGRKWVAAGDDAPAEGTADCLYRDRLFRTSTYMIMCSRQMDTTDWDYSTNIGDPGRPFFFQLGEAGEIGDTVVALVPHKDKYLLAFTADELWLISGDPTTGTMRNISREVGIIAARAWCKRENTIFFLSSNGLYSVSADGSDLRAVSEDKIPQELLNVSDANCVLSYTHADRGVSIHLTAAPSWFYDSERDGFWPYSTATTDSHLLVGPIRLGDALNYGMIQQLHGIIAENSATVQWRVVPGDTAEQAADNGKAAITAAVAGNDYDQYITSTGAWDAGRSPIEWPRATSMWACLWLASEGTWAFEGIHMVITPYGKWRA